MQKLLPAFILAFSLILCASATAAPCPTSPVTFKVTDPAASADEIVYVSGNQPALGSWTATDGNMLKRDGTTATWSATLLLPPETNIQFKFMKRNGGAGSTDIWESGIPTNVESRVARTPACGTDNFVIDGGSFRQAELAHNAFADDLTAPKGRKGEHIKALATALNANSPVATREFFARHATPEFAQALPMEMNEKLFAARYRRTGGIDVRGIRTYQYPQPETSVLVGDRIFGSWYVLFIAFEEGSEERIAGIGVQRARTPKLPPMTEAAFIAETRALFARGCKSTFFSGTLLVSRKGKVLAERVCGEASKRYHVPNNIDTKFNLGSMNKMFTAVAISQLVEQGKLKVSDTIDAFVDETWLPKEITSQVTIHQLLSHTSGLGSYFNDKYWNSSRLLYREVNDYKPLVVGDKLQFKPGERFGYSNTGMLLLGVVIEKISGQNYFDYVREHIYKPAGMINSDSYSMDDPVENLAAGYLPASGQPGKWTDNTLMHVLRGGPAGGGYSTVRDLDKFVAALQGGKLLKQESLALHWQDYSKSSYGYGFQVMSTPNGKLVGHGGGFPGLNGQLDVYLDKGYVVAVLANHDSAANPLATRIGQLLEQVK